VNASDVKPLAANGPSPVYRLGLFFVVLGMLVLPVIYFALTALACWWVWYFATQYFVAIWQIPLGYSIYGLIFRIVLSFTPVLVGGAIALAMVKPLFARRGKHMQPLVLQPEVEPRLHTHPCSADRIRRARKYADAGVLTSEAPARELLVNFEAISRLVTLAHYEDDLNVPTTADFLIPLEALIKEANAPAPVVATAKPAPVPMMAYDPSKFRKPTAQGGE
jgi:hypothetical protein